MTEIQCRSCQDGFSMSNDFLQCNAGLVLNCLVYTQGSLTSCQQCSEGYAKISKSVDVCQILDSSLNCLQANLTKQLDCLQCTQQNMALVLLSQQDPATTMQTICLQSQTIPFCQDYNINSDFNSTDFQCKKCVDGYYLSNYRCLQRQNKFQQCLVYTVDRDTCSQCYSGYYLSEDQSQCIKYPQGVIGCWEFTDDLTCSRCQKGLYLSNNACNQIPLDQLVDNCDY